MLHAETPKCAAASFKFMKSLNGDEGATGTGVTGTAADGDIHFFFRRGIMHPPPPVSRL